VAELVITVRRVPRGWMRVKRPALASATVPIAMPGVPRRDVGLGGADRPGRFGRLGRPPGRLGTFIVTGRRLTIWAVIVPLEPVRSGLCRRMWQGNICQLSAKEQVMKLRFLGKVTEAGNSPTLYDTDQDMYLIQGWTVEDPEALSQLALPDGETAVVVPKALMKHLPKEEHGATDA